MIDNYILDADGNPTPCENIVTWAKWFEAADRRVAHEKIGPDHKGRYIEVSTVFLGIDHSFGLFHGMARTHPPILFETMVFGGTYSEEQQRYCTRDEALAGHAQMVALVKKDFVPIVDIAP